MCGRYTLAANGQLEFRTRFGLGERVEVRQRFNVCPGDDVLAVVRHDGEREAALLHWGLVPHWAKDPSVGYRMINARSETAAEKPAFAESLLRRRCLILADGFYEWQPRPGQRRKQPWHITLQSGAPFAFAGLWATWHMPDGDQVLRSCTILTRPAEAEVAELHDRQPVILAGPEAEAAWLDPEASPDRVRALMRASAPELLAPRPGGFAGSDAHYDGPACLDDPEPEAQSALWSD